MPIPRNVAPLTTVAHSWLIHGTDERRRGRQVNVGGGGGAAKTSALTRWMSVPPPRRLRGHGSTSVDSGNVVDGTVLRGGGEAGGGAADSDGHRERQRGR